MHQVMIFIWLSSVLSDKFGEKRSFNCLGENTKHSVKLDKKTGEESEKTTKYQMKFINRFILVSLSNLADNLSEKHEKICWVLK